MLTRIDHVMICVPDLQQGIDAYTRLGNTGEQAMLVRPDDACGAYIGFVGPA